MKGPWNILDILYFCDIVSSQSGRRETGNGKDEQRDKGKWDWDFSAIMRGLHIKSNHSQEEDHNIWGAHGKRREGSCEMGPWAPRDLTADRAWLGSYSTVIWYTVYGEEKGHFQGRRRSACLALPANLLAALRYRGENVKHKEVFFFLCELGSLPIIYILALLGGA